MRDERSEKWEDAGISGKMPNDETLFPHEKNNILNERLYNDGRTII